MKQKHEHSENTLLSIDWKIELSTR